MLNNRRSNNSWLKNFEFKKFEFKKGRSFFSELLHSRNRLSRMNCLNRLNCMNYLLKVCVFCICGCILSGCASKNVIVVPENFCPKKLHLNTSDVNIFCTTDYSDEVFFRIALDKQAKQWVLDRFEVNRASDNTIKVNISIKAKKSIQKAGVVFVDLVSKYDVFVTYDFCQVDTSGNIIASFKIEESGELELVNSNSIDEVYSLNKMVAQILKRVDIVAVNEMKKLSLLN